MTLKENKAIVRKVIEAFNKRNLTLLDKLLAPDFTDHDHQLKGPEDVKQFLTTFCQGFPDFRMTIEDIIAEGDKVWVCKKR